MKQTKQKWEWANDLLDAIIGGNRFENNHNIILGFIYITVAAILFLTLLLGNLNNTLNVRDSIIGIVIALFFVFRSVILLFGC